MLLLLLLLLLLLQQQLLLMLCLGCLTPQPYASMSKARVCLDDLICCHTETEAADQTCNLSLSQYTDTGPASLVLSL